MIPGPWRGPRKVDCEGPEPPALAPAHLTASELTVHYGDQVALQDVTFRVPEGSLVAVVGPNGAGKSTLFKVIVGLIPPTRGCVQIHDLPAGRNQYCVAYVPQREEVDWRFPVTVTDVVMMGRYGRMGWLDRPHKEDRLAVRRALEQMAIGDLAGKSIGELSGGQQQRVFLARALAQEPHILLMDEPFASVDATTQELTLQLLEQVRAKGVTVLVSTHDLRQAATRFERILLLNRHVIAFGTPDEVFTPEHVRAAFGGQVLFLGGVAVLDEHIAPDGPEHAPAIRMR